MCLLGPSVTTIDAEVNLGLSHGPDTDPFGAFFANRRERMRLPSDNY